MSIPQVERGEAGEIEMGVKMKMKVKKQVKQEAKKKTMMIVKMKKKRVTLGLVWGQTIIVMMRSKTHLSSVKKKNRPHSVYMMRKMRHVCLLLTEKRKRVSINPLLLIVDTNVHV
jgi:hypothetical protein